MSSERTEIQSDEQTRRAQQLSLQRNKPPAEVAGYDVERFLGAGAYGEVWVAVDRNTGRRVAIKFYTHRGGLDWSLLSREVEKLVFLSADRYVVHQVSQVHTAMTVELLGLDATKVPITFPTLGNVGPASIPITLSLGSESLSSGDKVILMGIGSGINASGIELIW